MKIYFVISINPLKQTKTNELNKKIFFISDSIIVNKHDKYVVEKIIKFKIKDEKSKYIIK